MPVDTETHTQVPVPRVIRERLREVQAEVKAERVAAGRARTHVTVGDALEELLDYWEEGHAATAAG